MLDGGISSIGFAMTTRIGILKKSNVGEDFLEKGSRGENIVRTIKDLSTLRKHASNSTGELLHA